MARCLSQPVAPLRGASHDVLADRTWLLLLLSDSSSSAPSTHLHRHTILSASPASWIASPRCPCVHALASRSTPPHLPTAAAMVRTHTTAAATAATCSSQPQRVCQIQRDAHQWSRDRLTCRCSFVRCCSLCCADCSLCQVVICAGVVSKSGRVLLARAFTSLSRSRLEGYMQSFPKLVGFDSQHTFIETDSIRYVYQPMESIYVLLITNKQSNIIEDLETLRGFAKLLPEYCGGQAEEQIAARVFELSFAVDELLTHGGYREHVTLQQIKTFTEMDSHEEKLQKIIMESKMNQARDEARRKASDIDQQKAQLRQAQAMAGGGGGKYSSYGSENAPQRDVYSDRSNNSGSGNGGYERVQPQSEATKKPVESSSSSSSSSAASKGKVKGMQLSKAKKTDDFFAQLNKEEKLAPPTGKVGPIGGSASASSAAGSSAAAAAVAAKQSVRVLVEEKVVCVLDREGGIKKLEIKGEMKLSIFDPSDSKILVQTSGPLHEKDGFKCRLHPKINKALWTANGGLGLGDPTKSFPVGSDNAPIIVKWSVAAPLKANARIAHHAECLLSLANIGSTKRVCESCSERDGETSDCRLSARFCYCFVWHCLLRLILQAQGEQFRE